MRAELIIMGYNLEELYLNGNYLSEGIKSRFEQNKYMIFNILILIMETIPTEEIKMQSLIRKYKNKVSL